MSREIKFRAWNKKRKKMFGWDIISTAKADLVLPWLHIQRGEESNILMQYTGLKDKNGKEIYCSDYIRTPAGIGLIKWDKCYRITWKEGGGTPLYNTPPKKMEVIGNIYENKDLLKEAL